MAETLEHLHDHVLDYTQVFGILHQPLRQTVDLREFAPPSVSRGAACRLERRLHVGADANGEVKFKGLASLQVNGKPQFAAFRIPSGRRRRLRERDEPARRRPENAVAPSPVAENLVPGLRKRHVRLVVVWRLLLVPAQQCRFVAVSDANCILFGKPFRAAVDDGKATMRCRAANEVAARLQRHGNVVLPPAQPVQRHSVFRLQVLGCLEVKEPVVLPMKEPQHIADFPVVVPRRPVVLMAHLGEQHLGVIEQYAHALRHWRMHISPRRARRFPRRRANSRRGRNANSERRRNYKNRFRFHTLIMP